jgi:penicillin-binding protein 1C
LKTKDTSIGTGKLSFLTIVILILGVYLIAPLPKGHLQGNYSQVILGSDSSFLRVFLNEDEQWCLPPKLQSGIPDKLVKSVLTYEDEYFQYHPGVNPLALFRALYVNLRNRRIVSGGSTITMQLARMVQNNPRNIWYKLKEMLFAFKLELAYSKKEILSQYLCHAPYGSNIRGYIAASYRYFGKSPGRLTWAEAATLAVLPNAPGMVFPTKNDERLKSKRDSLLLKLMKKEVIDRETFELSLLEKLPAQIIPFPLKAPHLTNRIRSKNHLDIVRTTIDPGIQNETDFFLKQHVAGLQQMGIMNACALVIDNTSGKVLSYVGSQDFNDLEHQGRVDGIMAPRSSGSILKPYLYASAIDEGLILPQTLIRDVPTYFNSFSPSNASENFSGIARASTALVHSLNVPAVRLLNAYGVQRFYHQLKAAGVSTLFRHADDYGLPIILGGAEVNPWDIGKLYSGMANGGVFRNISYLSNMEDGNPSQLVSSGACFLVLDELKELIRPGLEFYWKKYGNQRQIAWKTGTSYGHKDAWAVGCTPQWTIVVWVGNFDGTPNKSLSGMRSAGPLMFNILNALPEERSKSWFKANPHDFVKVKLCRQTGFYPSDNCTDKIEVQAPKKMRPLKTCQYHQKYVIDPLEHHAVCSYCWSGDRMEQYVLKYPPDVNYYLRKNGKVVEKDPVHNPDCKIAQERDILQIIYPLQQANIFIPKDFDGNYQPLVSRLATHFPDRTVFWYLDDSYLGSTKDKSTLPLHLNAGDHTLTVVDVMGNRDQVDFSVILN